MDIYFGSPLGEIGEVAQYGAKGYYYNVDDPVRLGSRFGFPIIVMDSMLLLTVIQFQMGLRPGAVRAKFLR